MPFMDMPPGSTLSAFLVKPYGAFIRRMRGITNTTAIFSSSHG
jgi:hydrogenase small subunit